MATISKRQKEIILYLMKKTGYSSLQELARAFLIHERTCRNDISSIEAFLNEQQLALKKKSGKGFCLDCSAQEARHLENILQRYETRFYSKPEREILSIALFLTNETITFQQLADLCQVSRQTIVNQIDALEQRLRKNSLVIEKIPGSGLRLTGEEKNIRAQFLELLSTDLCRDEIYQLLSACPQIGRQLQRAQTLLEQVQLQKKLVFIDRKRIQYIFAYLLYRTANGHTLREDWVNSDHSDLKQIIRQYFPSDAEQYFIFSLIQAERISSTESSNENDEAKQISQDLIYSLNQVYPIEPESFKEIIDGLTTHLRAAIYRSRNKYPSSNVILNDIKMSASLMFEFTKKELFKAEEKYGIVFDENEVAYIVMYLTSIYEASIQDTMAINILVICSYGLAASAVLKLRLKQAFPDCNLWGPCSIGDVEEYLKENPVDFIISADYYANDYTPVIIVDPMLTDKDLDQIRSQIYRDTYSKMCSTFLHAGFIAAEHRYIGQYIQADHIQITEHCKSWQQAITLAATPLLRKKFINMNYVTEMIHAVGNYGTYMVLTPEIAYVHAGINDGIYEDCAAMLLLRKPIEFGAFNKKRIRAVIVLGIKNKKKDSNLINLAYILEKEENVQQLKRNDITVEELLKLHD